MVSSRRSAKCPVLKFNQGSKVFEDVSGTIIVLGFTNVLQIFVLGALKNNYKMYLDLR